MDFSNNGFCVNLVATVQDIEMEINEDSDVEMAEIPGNNWHIRPIKKVLECAEKQGPFLTFSDFEGFHYNGPSTSFFC